MEIEFIKNQKEKLILEKKSLEESLSSFASKDKKLKGDWDTSFPNYGENESGNAGEGSLDAEADEVEEYEKNLSVEHTLEEKLQRVSNALEKIENGNYGKCKNCNKEIEKERLEIMPEADLCLQCEKNQS
ncbi:MAG TPA: TraR/DksA C4-type zinc finger protein [Candidatus Pacearchaeota archaeon]|nr:TraR/DksA C4-type zinc finger protein [Candidatus Pacearchaeota archaeon]